MTSIGYLFKQQLQHLFETLSSTEPPYIRCVKPNNLLKPAIFENKNVLQQLWCGIGQTAELDAHRSEAASLKIQSYLRMHFASIQTGMAATNESHFGRQTTAAILILFYMRLNMENAKLQLDLQEMQIQFKETKEMLVKEGEDAKTANNAILEKITTENEKLKANLEAKTQENAKLQLTLQEMRVQFKQTKEMFIKEMEDAKTTNNAMLEKLTTENEKLKADLEEAKTQENAKLQLALQEMQDQFKETKEMLVKEREDGKMAKNAILEKLVIENEKLKANLVDAKAQENAKLQLALQEMQVQIKETKKMLVKEREDAKTANNAMLEKLTIENEKLKDDLEDAKHNKMQNCNWLYKRCKFNSKKLRKYL